MPIYYSQYGSQANTGTGVLGCVVQTLKSPKKLVGVSHIKTGTVIVNKICRFIPVLGCAEFYSRFLTFTSKLPGITNQVFK